jgi:peptide deformylase
MGDPRLLARALPVEQFGTAALHALIEDLFDTMHAHDGAGIAAPQIGVQLQVVIFGFERNLRYPEAPPVPETVLINPTIEVLDERLVDGFEGCLSVPGMRGLVPRYQAIRYSGYTPEGHRFERTADGFHARVVQHECDHLAGVLYPTRIRDLKRFGFIEELSAS